MHISIFLIIISAVALGFAYISEHVFGLLPCILCIYQRMPYFVIIALSALSLAFKGRVRLALIALCGLTFLVGAGIAAFHVGVEKGKFHMETACVDTNPAPTTLEEMRNQIIGKAAAPCDKPQFVFLGISMAGWNFFFSAFSAFFTLRMVWRAWKGLNDE